MSRGNMKTINQPANNKNGKLAVKQERFVREYVKDLNGKQAAIRAGYSERSAKVTACRILTHANVQQALATLIEARNRDKAVDARYVVETLRENVDRSMQVEPILDRDGVKTGEYVYAGAVANRALELLGKHLGMFVDRVDHTGEVTISAIKRTVVHPNDT